MPDNTNVNNNASVVVIGRTAPVPAGQQKSEKSVPVVIANDQSPIPVEEQNKIQSEVALSLLGIPRSEVALGIFADVNTYDVNPTEWSSFPEQFSKVSNAGVYAGIGQTMGWGLSHVPEESGAMIEAPPDRYSVLTSKRFFRYQPGRVSAATFGVKTTKLKPDVTGATVQNPCIRKYGIFDNFDGYYWETRNNGAGDNFCVVRRTQANTFENPIEFNTPGNREDYARTNPQDPFGIRGSESQDDATAQNNPPAKPKKFGDLVILRDNLLMTHAAVYDPSLLQPEYKVGIASVSGGNTLQIPGISKSISDATYNIDTGIMVITTSTAHGFGVGKFITLSGIGMTCYLDPSVPKIYPNRASGYNVIQVDSPTVFRVNVGVSTVPTFYVSGGTAVGLTTGQYVSYSKGTNVGVITGLTDTSIYRVAGVTTTGNVTLKPLNSDAVITGLSNGTYTNHEIITPVPFVQPLSGQISEKNRYTSIVPSGTTSTNPNAAGTGMFPYLYTDTDGITKEGYIDTTLSSENSATLKTQIDAINSYYDKWVNQNVAQEYLNVYEYRVPRSRFSGDRLDNLTDDLVYSDAVANNRAGQNVIDADTGEIIQDTSIWNLSFDKVTMYKIEFSWYGAVGGLFLAYVPVSNGEARWVRVHHLRASNQLKVSSLGNATLPITYLVYGGGNKDRNGYLDANRPEASFSYGTPSEHIIKYGASYYIDGGDRGTVKLFSTATPTAVDVYGSKRSFTVGAASTQVSLTNAGVSTDPFITAGENAGLSSSYYVGAKIITNNPLDQGIEVVYVNPITNKLHLNSPLNLAIPPTSITIIPDRKTPLIGLKCKDFIQSSTGRNVRNRTQVYPTRLSTGSTGVIKVDLLKTPIFQTTSTVTGITTISADVNIGKSGSPTIVTLTNTGYLSTSTGTYGYFRGYFQNDPSQRKISVLGYLENRVTNGYHFNALNSTSDSIILTTTDPFLREENHNPVGNIVSPTTSESTLAQLSSVKVSPQIRSPIPKTGTVVSSLFIPASGEEYDLSPYFDYNKEYLSFPLTNVIESLYLCGSSQIDYNSSAAAASVSASLTWEEQ